MSQAVNLPNKSLDQFTILNNIKSILGNLSFYSDLAKSNDDNFSLESLQYNSIHNLISQETLEYHHGKHHKTYLDNLNNLKPKFEQLITKFSSNQDYQVNAQNNFIHQYYLDSLFIIETLANEKSKTSITLEEAKLAQNVYNNSAQCINHSFYWKSLTDKDLKSSSCKTKIIQNFTGEENFKAKFLEQITQFGSGWIWLVINNNSEIFFTSTSNADNPLSMGLFPLMVCDIWEHAYYIDYRNKRGEYVSNFFNCINWDFVESNLSDAQKFFEAI